MNYAIVFRLLGYVLMIEGALLLLPAAASGFYGEWFVLMYSAISFGRPTGKPFSSSGPSYPEKSTT